MWCIVFKGFAGFNVALLFFLAEKFSSPGWLYVIIIVCLQPIAFSQPFCFSCQSDSLEMEKKDRSRFLRFSFRQSVFCGLCFLKKRHHTCLKRLRILSVQPMDCCNWETQTDKLMFELWARKQALNNVTVIGSERFRVHCLYLKKNRLKSIGAVYLGSWVKQICLHLKINV